MRSQEAIMRDAGYITAAEAAEAIGVANIGTIHRMVTTGRVKGARAGSHWYVLVKSLLEAHKDAPPLLARIRALGVEAKDATMPTPKKGGRRARRAS